MLAYTHVYQKSHRFGARWNQMQTQGASQRSGRLAREQGALTASLLYVVSAGRGSPARIRHDEATGLTPESNA